MAFTLRNNVTVRGSAEGTEGRGRKEEQEQEGGKREISLSLSLSLSLSISHFFWHSSRDTLGAYKMRGVILLPPH